jgi:DDE family transposase
MSPQGIVRDTRALIQNKFLPVVPGKWVPLVRFGLAAYSLQTFQSATGNARRVVARPGTAARKSERLLAHARLADQFGSIFDTLGLVKPSGFVNVDHSDMNGLTALVGAVQTRKGRAIPCMVETTYSDRLPGHEDAPPRKKALRQARKETRTGQSFTDHIVASLQAFHDRLGFWPRLVFDRGFGNETVVTHLAHQGATFYIRLKAGRYIELDGERFQVKELTGKDTPIRLYGLTLRVIRSPRSRRCKEPWYILTNDLTSSRTKVVRIYYHRFEIEESFKDIKHILELRRTRLNRPNSLTVILWLICLGIALLYVVTRPENQTSIHPKKRCSWIRLAMEQLYRAYNLVLWGEV